MFGVVQAHQISSNLLRMNDIRESEVYRVVHISSGWFKHIEPHRTSSECLLLERARCVHFCHISSGCFKHIEPQRTSSKLMMLERERCRVFSHKFGVVQAHRTSSNLFKKHALRESAVYRGFHRSSGWFKHIKSHRTSSEGMIVERARCIEFFT